MREILYRSISSANDGKEVSLNKMVFWEKGADKSY
nr:MAG TPA: hypothetical protein [Caudoviricetes sp.]